MGMADGEGKEVTGRSESTGIDEAVRRLCLGDERKKRICDAALDRFIRIAAEYDLKLSPSDVHARLCSQDSYVFSVVSELLQVYARADELADVRIGTSGPRLSLTPIPCVDAQYTALQPFLADFERALPSRMGRVLIKPNIVSSEPFPETSDPALLRGVIDAIVPYASSVVVGDGPSLFYSSDAAIKRMSRIVGVPISDFNRSEYVGVGLGEGYALPVIEFPRMVLEVDCVVSIASFKQHNAFEYSGAQKNVVGMLSPASRLLLHRVDPAARADALRAVSDYFMPRLTIVDAREVMLHAQQRAYGGVPVPGPGIFLGVSPVSTDARLRDWIQTGGLATPISDRFR